MLKPLMRPQVTKQLDEYSMVPNCRIVPNKRIEDDFLWSDYTLIRSLRLQRVQPPKERARHQRKLLGV